MISAILFLFAFFSYSQMECDICSWPWAAGVNTQGQCYLLYQNGVPLSQGGLQSGCYTYCDAWARSSGNSMPATPMLSFSDVGGAISCQCQRLNAWGEIEYRSRPSGSCDWGYSDAVQKHYDSISQNLSPNSYDSSIVNQSKLNDYKQVLDMAAQLHNAGYIYTGCGYDPTAGREGLLFQNLDYNSTYISLPGQLSCLEVYSGAMNDNSIILQKLMSAAKFNENTQLAMKSGVDQVQKTVASGQSSILDALARLEAKPSGGGGGEVNLGPVLAAIEAAKQAQLDATRGVGDSVGSMKTLFSARFSSLQSSVTALSTDVQGVQSSIEAQGVTLGEIKTELTGLGGKMAAVADSVGGVRREVANQTDTVVSVRRAVDRLRGVLDSMYRWDKDETAPRLDRIREAIDKQNRDLGDSVSSLKPYYQKIVDSLRRVARGTDSVGARMSRSIDTIGSVRRSVTSMDSGVEARWRSDKRDDSGAYNRMMDSIRGRDGSRAEAESKLSELEGTSSAAEDQSTGFLSSLGLFQSLPGTCREAPVFTLDLSPMGSMSIDINQYPWALTLSRGLMRFVGAFSALMMIMGSLKIFSMTRREAT